jgi:hypothetical protein
MPSGYAVAFTVTAILFSILAVMLVGLGSSTLHKDKCKAQPSLPVWMIVAGVCLLIMTMVTAILLYWRQKLAQQKATVLSVCWAFCCGVFLLLGYLIWFGMWIAGTYVSILTVRSIRIHQMNNGQDGTLLGCDMATVCVAGVSVVLVWIVFIGLCSNAIWTLIHWRRRRPTENPQKKILEDKHLYDMVPTTNGV